jgi:hypothetical protein
MSQKFDRSKKGDWSKNKAVLRPGQDCQMVYLQNKNPNLGTFWSTFKWKMLAYLMASWTSLHTLNILWPFVNFVVIEYFYIPRFGILYPEKIWQHCAWPLVSHLASRYKIRVSI